MEGFAVRSSSAEQRVLREERGEREPPVWRLRCWGCRVAHQWLQSPNYISLMSTHTIIRGSSGAKRRSRLF